MTNTNTRMESLMGQSKDRLDSDIPVRIDGNEHDSKKKIIKVKNTSSSCGICGGSDT